MHKNNNDKENNNPFSEANNVTEENNVEKNKQEENTAQEINKNKEQNELEAIKEKHENLNNQYIRLAADFENFRKRQDQEREALLKYGTEDALKKIIPVLDNFDRAQKSINSVEDCAALKETFNILEKQTFEALSKIGLEPINTQGEKFDPNFHEAVMKTPTDEYPEETIINELQKGYKFGEKVLRPALVDVAVQ